MHKYQIQHPQTPLPPPVYSSPLKAVKATVTAVRQDQPNKPEGGHRVSLSDLSAV